MLLRIYNRLEKNGETQPSLRDEDRRSRGRIESARPDGESETHRTAGGGAAGELSRRAPPVSQRLTALRAAEPRDDARLRGETAANTAKKQPILSQVLRDEQRRRGQVHAGSVRSQERSGSRQENEFRRDN